MADIPESSHEDEKIERLRRAMYSRSLSPKFKGRERRVLDLSPGIVGEDFKRVEPELSPVVAAPRGITAARTALWWLLLLAVVFFVGAVGFFVYFFTIGAGSSPASPSNIDISVSGPPQVAGGERTELQVVVTNRNSVPLQLADLVFTYPNGTRSPSDFSTDLPTQRISLGTIDPGQTRQGTISAVFAGSEGEHENVKAQLEYHLSGSNAVFTASTDYDLSFGSSPVSISIDSNTETISGQPIQLAVTVASNANAPIKDLLLGADLPFGFKLTSANPAAASGSLWELGDLNPGDKKTVTIQGTLTGQEGDQRVFNFTAGTRTNASSTSIDTALSAISQTVTISQPFLGLNVSVNSASGASAIASPGSTVNVSIAYQNNLSTAITSAVIVARLTGVQIDGSTVKTTNGFFRSTDDSMLWDKTTDTDFSTLAPGAKGAVTFSFQMPTSDALKNVQNPHLAISINAAGDRVSETGVPETLQASAVTNIGIASDLEYTAQGLYYADPFGSSGPLPPKAGTETTYALVFTVSNTTNKITNASLTATLPPYVRWLGRFSPPSENVTFNQNNGTLTWNIGDIAPNVGLNGAAPRQAAVAVGFTPSTSQIGENPPLLENITLTGTDNATGNIITEPVANVTTDLSKPSKSSQNTPAGVDPGFVPADATVVGK